MLSSTATKHFTRFTNLTMERRLQAIDIAQYIVDHGRGVLAIELFGSLARGNVTKSSDFDFIVTIDGFDAASWMQRFESKMSQDCHASAAKDTRRSEAIVKLGLDTWDPDNMVDDDKVDIFLFPPKWQERGWTLSTFWKGWDEEFTNNMRQDAIMFVPGQGFPFPLQQREARRVDTWAWGQSSNGYY